MKRLSILVIALVAFVGSAFAQSRTSYFMEGSYFRTDLNPALAPTRGYLALPGIGGIGLDIPNNFLSIDNFVFQKEGQMVTAFHGSVSPEEFLSKLPEVGRLGVNANVNILGLGFYTRKVYWNIGARLRSNTDLTLSKELFSALKSFGNRTYDLSSTSINSNSYLEAYLGTSFPIGKHVNVGLRAKVLVGILNLHSDFNQVEAFVGADKVTATLRGRVVANSILIDQSKIKADEPFSMDMLSYNDVNAMLDRAKSYGAAVDLGVELKFFHDHLKVSAAVTDLGFIKWHHTTNYSATAAADFAFDGLSVDENFEVGDKFMKSSFNFTSDAPSARDYTTVLNGSLNAGVEYNFLRNHFALGVMSRTELYNNRLFSEITASFNIRPNSWMTATVSHTFLEHNAASVYGVALNIHPCVFNIFVGADFVDTQYGRFGTIPVPRFQNSVNVYAGFGFNFARPKHVRAAVKAARDARREARIALQQQREQERLERVAAEQLAAAKAAQLEMIARTQGEEAARAVEAADRAREAEARRAEAEAKRAEAEKAAVAEAAAAEAVKVESEAIAAQAEIVREAKMEAEAQAAEATETAEALAKELAQAAELAKSVEAAASATEAAAEVVEEAATEVVTEAATEVVTEAATEVVEETATEVVEAAVEVVE